MGLSGIFTAIGAIEKLGTGSLPTGAGRVDVLLLCERTATSNVTGKDLRDRELREYARVAMSFKRSTALTGLLGLGLWLLGAAPVHANEATPESLIVEAPPGTMGTGNVSRCTFRGIKLAGKVKVVDSFPDIRVKAVRSFPDLKVKKVDSFPDDCGEWKFVDSFPDFKIQYVDSFPDVEVAWVDSFPGMP